MSDSFVAEIKIFAGNFAPVGWATCNGQLMPISQNTALFSLLGTTFGGNGQSNFGLPDMQGKAPMFWGNGAGLSQRFIGEQGGVQNVTLLQTEMPLHNHAARASSQAGDQTGPANTVWASSAGGRTPPPLYSSTSNTPMALLATGNTGSNLPHNNMQPYLVVTFIIALQGIFPSRA
jgi:microcystin-dependent protein